MGVLRAPGGGAASWTAFVMTVPSSGYAPSNRLATRRLLSRLTRAAPQTAIAAAPQARSHGAAILAPNGRTTVASARSAPSAAPPAAMPRTSAVLATSAPATRTLSRATAEGAGPPLSGAP